MNHPGLFCIFICTIFLSIFLISLLIVVAIKSKVKMQSVIKVVRPGEAFQQQAGGLLSSSWIWQPIYIQSSTPHIITQ